MNLRDIREEFVKKSGRYDLVQDDENYKDNGANFFIQAGQRFLDKQGDFGTGIVQDVLFSTEIGQRDYVVKNCWNIISLYFSRDSQNQCFEKAERVYTIECDKCRFGNGIYYALVPLRSAVSLQSSSAKDLDIPASALDLSANHSNEDIKGLKIQLSPKPSSVFLMKAIGNFYSTELTNDKDTSYWTLYQPEMLLKSAMYELEVFYRNSEGARDWLEALSTDLRNLEQSQLLSTIQGDLCMGE